MEKAVAGMAQGGKSDGGVGSRMLQSFLTWMQSHEKTILFMCTANDAQMIPAELLRPGRLDAMFYAGFPNDAARKEIWSIVHREFGKDTKKIDLDRLVKLSENRTGAEIRTAFTEAHKTAFANEKSQPTTDQLAAALLSVPSVAEYDKERIEAIRVWAAKSARGVEGDEDCVEQAVTKRKEAARRVITDAPVSEASAN